MIWRERNCVTMFEPGRGTLSFVMIKAAHFWEPESPEHQTQTVQFNLGTKGFSISGRRRKAGLNKMKCFGTELLNLHTDASVQCLSHRSVFHQIYKQNSM